MIGCASSDLRRGLVLVGLGVGLTLALALVRVDGASAEGLWSLGSIPMNVGAGYLMVWQRGRRIAR